MNQSRVPYRLPHQPQIQSLTRRDCTQDSLALHLQPRDVHTKRKKEKNSAQNGICLFLPRHYCFFVYSGHAEMIYGMVELLVVCNPLFSFQLTLQTLGQKNLDYNTWLKEHSLTV